MVTILDRALAQLDILEKDEQTSAIDRLRAVARWTMEVQLAGEMPALPAQNSVLRHALMTNRVYLDRLMLLSDRLGAWITAAKDNGDLNPQLPLELVLYTLFARACDPVLGLLKAGGQYDDQTIIEMLLRACFEGLSAR